MGFELKDKIQAAMGEVKRIEQQISGYTSDIDGMNRKWEELKAEADKPVRTDPKTIPEYQELQAGIDELDRKLASLEDQSAIRGELNNRESAAREKIDVINAALAKIDANERLMERIEQLKAEKRARPLYKVWWFYIIVAFFLALLYMAVTGQLTERV